MAKPTKYNIVLFCFIAAKFFLQFILISPVYDLHRDEYLHLDQANHLAWGYVSVPPFTSWIAVLIKAAGNHVFWVKFYPALFGALTLVVVWKTAKHLGAGMFALCLSALTLLFSVHLRINTLFQPNSFDILCWCLMYYFLVRYASDGVSTRLGAAALVFAFGFLNKYNIAFQMLGLLPAILFTRMRKMFADRKLYAYIGMACAILLPHLLWQYNNGFPVFAHLRELTNTQLVHVERSAFLKSQLLMNAGALVPLFLSFYALIFYKHFRPYRFLGIALLSTLLLFLYFRAKDYYALGLYPVFIAFGAVYLQQVTVAGKRKVIRVLALLWPILLFVPFFRVGFPNKTPEQIAASKPAYQRMGLLRWEDGKDHEMPQDFADMLGWRSLAVAVDRVVATLPAAENTMIICDNYGQAGAINYYAHPENRRAVSFNADYIDWFNFYAPVDNIILVKEKKMTTR